MGGGYAYTIHFSFFCGVVTIAIASGLPWLLVVMCHVAGHKMAMEKEGEKESHEKL